MFNNIKSILRGQSLMKILIADTYSFYIHNSKEIKFPKEYKNFNISHSPRTDGYDNPYTFYHNSINLCNLG